MSQSPPPLKKVGAKVTTGSMGLIAKLSQMKESNQQDGQISPKPSPPPSKPTSPTPKASPSTEPVSYANPIPERSTSPKPSPPKSKPKQFPVDDITLSTENTVESVGDDLIVEKIADMSILESSAPSDDVMMSSHQPSVDLTPVEATESLPPPVTMEVTSMPAAVASPKLEVIPPTPPAIVQQSQPEPAVVKKAPIGSLLRAPKCSLCADNVYKMEELLAINQTWHKLCFKCGGTASDGCKRVLTLDKYLEHDQQPYCDACYTKLFRPKGFGFSNALAVDTGSQDNLRDGMNSMPNSTRGISPASSLQSSAASEKKSYSTSNTPAAGVGSVETKISSFSVPSTPSDSAANSMMGGKSVSVSTSSKKLALGGSMAPKCTICAKTVYKVEEVIAVGRTWHKTCFKCGGGASDGCGRGLTLDKYVDHDNQPYCNACYSKLFKPKGFGFGTNMQTATNTDA